MFRISFAFLGLSIAWLLALPISSFAGVDGQKFSIELKNGRIVHFGDSIRSLLLSDVVGKSAFQFFHRTGSLDERIQSHVSLTSLGIPPDVLTERIRFAEISPLNGARDTFNRSQMTRVNRSEGIYWTSATAVYAESKAVKSTALFVTDSHWFVIHQNGEVMFGSLAEAAGEFSFLPRADFWEKMLSNRDVLPFRISDSGAGVTALRFMQPLKAVGPDLSFHNPKAHIWYPRTLVISASSEGAGPKVDPRLNEYEIFKTRVGLLGDRKKERLVSHLNPAPDVYLKLSFVPYQFRDLSKVIEGDLLLLGRNSQLGGFFLRHGIAWVPLTGSADWYEELNDQWLDHLEAKRNQSDISLESVFRSFMEMSAFRSDSTLRMRDAALRISNEYCSLIAAKGQMYKHRIRR